MAFPHSFNERTFIPRALVQEPASLVEQLDVGHAQLSGLSVRGESQGQGQVSSGSPGPATMRTGRPGTSDSFTKSTHLKERDNKVERKRQLMLNGVIRF